MISTESTGKDECGVADGKTEAVSWQNSEPEQSEFVGSRNTNSDWKRGKGGKEVEVENFTSDVHRFAFDVEISGSRMIGTKEVIKKMFGSSVHNNLELIRTCQREKQKTFQQLYNTLEET